MNELEKSTKVKKLIEALESIASEDYHKNEEYWMTRTHEECATVLANDTKIAFEALREYKVKHV